MKGYAAPLVALGLGLAAWSCSSASSAPAGDVPTDSTAATSPSPPPASSTTTTTTTDAGGTTPTADGGDASAGTYRDSLGVCWTNAACTRALAVAHGGDWTVSGPPYDSTAALMAAYANGADGVKIDVRVTKDNVPVISHSSPLEYYESLDCGGKKIEDMTAAQVTGCHRFPSNTETFQRLDDVLDMLRGKLTIQLCVKLTSDFARTIAEVRAKKAEGFAYLEVNAGDMAGVAALPDADKVYYLVNVASDLGAVDTILAMHNPRIAMIEIDPTVSLNGLAASKLHPAGVRAFTYDDAKTTSQAAQKAHYDDGFDVVSSNDVSATVGARIQVNQARSVTPP